MTRFDVRSYVLGVITAAVLIAIGVVAATLFGSAEAPANRYQMRVETIEHASGYRRFVYVFDPDTGRVWMKHDGRTFDLGGIESATRAPEN